MIMNGTSTYGGHNTTYSFAARLGCDRKGWALGMTCLWKNWSIQLFVLLGLIFQSVLAVFGSRRKISSAETIRFVIWASYSLASYILTLALSKLSNVSLDKSEEEYDTELKALLAPLTLLLLGSPDSITAYSAEDNRVGVRSAMTRFIALSFVVWILWRCWKTSIGMILFFPIFVAGIIKCAETSWALYSVYNEDTSMREEDFEKEKEMFSALMDSHDEKETFSALKNFLKDVPDLNIVLKAYYRFDCLKPHLVDWLEHPFFREHHNKLIGYSPEEVFLTTDMELGFMYDVLYTKAPVLYTKLRITLRGIGYFSLLLTSGGFMGLFFDHLLRDPYIIYTFGLLIGAVLLETYQLLKLFDSDWVIIMNIKHHRKVSKFLKFLVKRSLKKKKLSRTIRQLNFLDFFQHDKRPWLFKILKLCGKAEKFMRYWATQPKPIPKYLKKLLLEDMEKFETKRDGGPFTKRGQWTLDACESLEKLRWSIEMAFDRSIIIWHIATHICNESCHENSDRSKASKLISDYMMFLLVRHPRILSLTTDKITRNYAYSMFEMFLKKIPEEQRDIESILEILSGTEYVQNLPTEWSLESVITRGWNVVEEARRLARQLKDTEDTWEIIGSVWVEMLCFAAYNSKQNHHVKLLRQGGEIITHVWLLLSHKTDKFNTIEFRNIKIE